MLKKNAFAMARTSAIAAFAVVGIGSPGIRAAGPPTPSAQIITLANRLAQLRVNYDPTIAYVTGLRAPDHSRFPDRSPRAIRSLERAEDSISLELARVPATGLDPKANATRAVLQEMLEASRQLRVCRAELWDLSHFTGWQVGFALVAEQQPVGTPALRTEALKRWGSLPAFLRVQTANLRAGLAAGYSVPKSVVNRVITQLDALVATAPDESPFYSPATRDGDAAFGAKLKSLIGERINPAIRDFRMFLAKDYLPHARDTLALSALPDGARCYQAQLRSYTTLDRTPAEVMALGEKTVKENEQAVIALGSQLYRTSDVAEIIKRNNDAADNHFTSSDELLAGARDLLGIAIEKSRPYFVKLPDQPVVVEPPPDYQRGTGISAHYEQQPDLAKPARYVEPTEEWKSQTRGLAEITLVHETVPGHHLQIALASESPQGSDLAKLADNSAYVEGWARYAERLSEEAGIYRSDYARISRRI